MSTNSLGRVPVPLTGVPETMLWPLYNRTAEARRPDARLRDPEAVRIADAIDYDYSRSFGKPDYVHALRALTFDRLLRDWADRRPGGSVVALGEGLETQVKRVDDGRVRWLSVDLPEAIEVRRRFLPDDDRHRNFACSALDFRWMDEVDPAAPVFVTAAGLLMYFRPELVCGLVAAIAERLPAAEAAFDVIPRWLSRKSLRGWRVTPHYTAPPMPWGLNRNEAAGLRAWHPNIGEVRVVDYFGGRGAFGLLARLARVTPGLCHYVPLILHLTCRPAGAAQ
jgi:O-methyltransferase involved in polyketide biosynthesis